MQKNRPETVTNLSGQNIWNRIWWEGERPNLHNSEVEIIVQKEECYTGLSFPDNNYIIYFVPWTRKVIRRYLCKYQRTLTFRYTKFIRYAIMVLWPWSSSPTILHITDKVIADGIFRWHSNSDCCSAVISQMD